MSELDLLRVEMDLLWGPDRFGRPHRSHPLMAIAVAADGQDVRFRPDLPEELRSRLAPISRQGVASFSGEPRQLPDPLRVEWGPSFVMNGDESAPPAPFRILKSNDPARSLERLDRPVEWGDDAEWRSLMAGHLGPWAVGLVDERVVGVCYTPAASLDAAEAGIWTAPSERGRGCAPAVTAAWASVARETFGTLFYSTGSANTSSQSVARKLGLRPIGTLWQFRSPGD